MGTRWSVDEDVALFAWLDFCIESGVNFQKTILEKVAEFGKNRTWNGIRNRLQSLVVNLREKDEFNRPPVSKGQEDNGKISVILKRGTECLKSPPEDFQMKLESALLRYRKDNLGNIEKLQSNEQSKPQTLSKRRAASGIPHSPPVMRARSESWDETEENSSEEKINQRKRQRLTQGLFEDAAKKKPQHDTNMHQKSLRPNSTKDTQPSLERTHSRSATTVNPQGRSFGGFQRVMHYE